MKEAKKYLNEGKGIGSCPFCRGVLFKDFKFDDRNGAATFLMRCPHCQKDVEIVIHHGALLVKKKNDGEQRE